MTEKQYTIVNMGLDGQYIKENGKIMTIERVVDLLKENEQLKHQLREYIDELAVIAVEYKAIESVNAVLEKKIHIYETTLKEAIQNERTHLGHNALKQLAENLEIL